MKRYLIDESTFKKFVAKVKASADGDKVTAVVHQSKTDKLIPMDRILLLSCCLVNLRKYAAPKNVSPPNVDPSQFPQNEPSQPQRLRKGRHN